jgi:hypothetical protein
MNLGPVKQCLGPAADAGVPQVARIKISGHKTDSMERRYNTVDAEDISAAKALMKSLTKSA